MDHQPSQALLSGTDGGLRCWWCVGDALYEAYHDDEWGRPLPDDRRLFEKLSLEGFQAGLSWLTILRKRPAFREAFAGFDFETLAGWGRRETNRLLKNAAIVRHRGKIESVLNNARRALELVEECGSLAGFFAQFTDEPGICDGRIAAATDTSHRLAKELKRRGWSFVGPTTVYAFMQSVGLVNDHWPGCPLRDSVEAQRRAYFKQLAADNSD